MPMIDAFQRHAFDGAVTGVSICDRDGRFLQVNDTYSAITGYPRSELLSLGCQGVIHPDDRSRCAQLAGKLFAGEIRHVLVETRCLRKDGDIRWLRASAALLPPELGVGDSALAIVEDISPLKDAEKARDAARKQLRRLRSALDTAREAEQGRVAREIHDGTAQLLTALSMNLAAMRDTGLEPERAAQLAAEALDLVEQCTREVRILSYLLHPPSVERLGWAAAIAAWVAGFAKRSGVDIELRIERGLVLEAEAERTLFRIIQEFVANLYRHRGLRAVIGLRSEDADAVLEVTDEDSGPGAEANLEAAIAGLKELVELAGGRVDIVPAEKGTRLTARIPAQPGI
jgi:two-component system NarL family sensor kinase